MRHLIPIIALILIICSFPVMSQEKNKQTNTNPNYSWQQKATTAVDSSVSTVSTSVPASVTSVKSKIKSVSLFKNGIALIREEFSVPTGGKYILNTIPYSIHGTFFVESKAPLETTVTQIPIREQLGTTQMLDCQKDLAGKRVRIFFNSVAVPPLTGTVVAIQGTETDKTQKPVSASEFSEHRYLSSAYYNTSPQNQPTDPILVVNTNSGQSIFRQSTIARIDVESEIGPVVRKKPAMVFQIKSDKPVTVTITYLTKGIAWSPAYKIILNDEKSNNGKLTIEQTATIINQWRKFTNAHVSLISGYPKIECENVTSPLSNNANLSTFFSQINDAGNSSNRGNMTSQMVMVSNTVSPDRSNTLPISSTPTMGDGPDIYYHSIGERTMEQGDVCVLSVGKQETDFDRVVEWTVQDNRDEWGRIRENQQNLNVPWDLIRFKNPFAFPMTTGPASVMTSDRFLGQNVSYWTAPGEQTSIPITKSLSVSVKSEEHETARSGDEVNVLGYHCRKVSVSAMLTVENRRSEPTPLVVERKFSGSVTQNEDDGKVVQLADQDLNALNRQNKIVWEFTLEPGEKKVLQYNYDVYVR